MEEYEILLNDLKYQEALLELERGYKITKKDIIDFVAELLKGDRNDKEYQQKIVDNLVSQVFVSDDHTVVYFNIKGGKTVDLVDLDDTNTVLKTCTECVKSDSFNWTVRFFVAKKHLQLGLVCDCLAFREAYNRCKSRYISSSYPSNPYNLSKFVS